MQYAYNKLRGKIIDKCGTLSGFSAKIGLSERSISLKMNGKRQWTQGDITKACDILEIDHADIPAYFFAPKVQ